MSEEKRYGFMEGNRIIFYILLPVMFLIIEISSNGWGNFDYLRFIVSTFVPILVLELLNMLSVKFDKWLEKRKLLKKVI
ncbi:MAG: hypothetical protein CVV25_10375 [Ignavibacteriae bacterium HGW-Ignavibacteriae-4]|jgi:hypothetical protein|nr:MAG: hypothetical protein CVV25_10375 [Ignavibacteriae bacterium HGW-Ignavibacteriae-4]